MILASPCAGFGKINPVHLAQSWLFKTEPDEFSIDDLAQKSSAVWDGVRNYTARNYLRDDVQLEDNVFIYHSSCKLIGIAGVATVVRSGYSDPAQFDSASPYFDAKSTREKPRWYCVDLQLKQRFDQLLPLNQLKKESQLADMVLLKQPRLSVQPVSANEYQHILAML